MQKELLSIKNKEEQPDMELENDVESDQFIVRFPRKENILEQYNVNKYT